MRIISIYQNATDPGMVKEQTKWALDYLTATLRDRRLRVAVVQGTDRIDSDRSDLRILVAGAASVPSLPGWKDTGGEVPIEAESFALANAAKGSDRSLFVIGSDVRGLVYALLELADIARHADDPFESLRSVRSVVEKPHHPVRSITRLFTSEPEDKPWFYDRSFWSDYLTELAIHRFNRFTFGVGAGYDYLIDRIVLDDYFCFFYPFVLTVPGYSVEAEGIAEEERERNLAMIRFIGREAKLRGIEFRLGLWNHAFDYGPDNTNPKHRIKGLNEHIHAPYCRDALALLLEVCPEIEGLTFRVHFEGGVPEPTHEFWEVVLERVKDATSLIDLDFHAKGVSHELIKITQQTGKSFALSAKYWAEHMGLPYHQASIRQKEFGTGSGPNATVIPSTGHHDGIVGSGMATTAKRSYTRYGYADFLRDDRPYNVIHRIWPGTQRILLWGDPAMAAGIGRFAGLCGSIGVEWFDPLSFKGKKGSGIAGGRELYEEEALKLGVRDWTKFLYTYRLWGRLAYNPDSEPESWRRYLRAEFGIAAENGEQALAWATRILPFITVVHAPSAANNVYWPEMYTNIPLVRNEGPVDNPYKDYGWPANADFDMEWPYTFMNTSSFDPALFYRINEFADDILSGRRCGRYSPLETAEVLDNLADRAEKHLSNAFAVVDDAQRPSFRRLEVDVRIMCGIGRFFARKFRAGLAYSLFEKANRPGLLTEAILHYRSAREAWREVVDASANVYRSDITFGHTPYSRGHWADRLEAIDADLATLERIRMELPNSQAIGASPGDSDCGSMDKLLAPFQGRLTPHYSHEPSCSFVKGDTIHVRIFFPEQAPDFNVRLYYRRTNQSIAYEAAGMRQSGASFEAVIPGAYTDSPYAIQYYFELLHDDGSAGRIPELAEDLSNQPYYVVQSRRKDEQSN